MLKWMTMLLAIIALPTWADEPAAAKGRSKLMMMYQTKVVEGKKLKGPPSEYQPDGDPNTIEMVILGQHDGPSRVSEDGEVIFLRDHRGWEAEIEKLLDQAFEIRFKLESEGT